MLGGALLEARVVRVSVAAGAIHDNAEDVVVCGVRVATSGDEAGATLGDGAFVLSSSIYLFISQSFLIRYSNSITFCLRASEQSTTVVDVIFCVRGAFVIGGIEVDGSDQRFRVDRAFQEDNLPAFGHSSFLCVVDAETLRLGLKPENLLLNALPPSFFVCVSMFTKALAPTTRRPVMFAFLMCILEME